MEPHWREGNVKTGAEILMIDQQVKEYEGLLAATRNNLPSSLWREDGPGDALISEFQPLEL